MNDLKKNLAGAVKLASLDTNEMGRELLVQRCDNCGNDSFHNKWERTPHGTMKLFATLCTNCKHEVTVDVPRHIELGGHGTH